MAIKAVIFDIGGVLEITPHSAHNAAWEQRLGLPDGEINRRLSEVWRAGSIGTISEAEVHVEIRAALSLDDAQFHAYLADLWSAYLGSLNVELSQYFGSLKTRCRTGILSNSFVGAREREEAAYRFSALTDTIVYSHEVGMKKPDPRVYLLVCDRLGTAPAETVFVDDIDVMVEAARAVGMHAIHFQDNAQAITEIEALLASD